MHRLSFDVTRRFIPIEILQKHLDGMRMSKLNVMQIHFTDSESFPIEIPSIPELSQYGAYSQDEVYTEYEIKKLQKYAQENGVLLIPEFDSPAHTRSWSQSEKFKDAGACTNTDPKNFWTYCLQPPCGNLDPTSEKTWEIINGIFNYTEKIFDSDIIHLGGDEVKEACWDDKPSIIHYMGQHNIKDYEHLEKWYKQKQSDLLPQYKRAIYWADKNALNIPLKQNDIIQIWDIEDKVKDIVNHYNKNDYILSPNNYLYLDCGRGNPIGGIYFWCDPYKTWYHIYQFNPMDYNTDNRLLGVTAPIWMEMVSPTQLDSMVYPRAISLSLRLWNPDEDLGVQRLAQKIVEQNNRLKKYLNMKVGAIGSQYCEKNINKCFFEGKIDITNSTHNGQ